MLEIGPHLQEVMQTMLHGVRSIAFGLFWLGVLWFILRDM